MGRRNRCAVNVAAFCGLLVCSGCATPKASVQDMVIEPESVAKEKIAGPSQAPVVLDVREKGAFEAGHLRGAIWLDLAEWSKLSRSSDSGFGDQAGWAQRIGKLGISNDSVVLVYDGGEMTEAARVWYILQLFGAWNAGVINGGWNSLQPALSADQIESGVATAPQPRQFNVWTRSGKGVANADKAAVRQNLGGKTAQVWDARSIAEFQGKDLKKNRRGGHIPGAINLSHTDLLDASGKLRSADELRKMLTAAGFQPGRPIIAHCQSGGRSSLAALAALRAGFGPISNYYMSFGEWAADETCPLELPDNAAASSN